MKERPDMIIRARAPLRLGLAGGGTDVSPYCDRYGGVVLNVTIDKYAYAIIEETSDGIIRFEAADQCVEAEYSAEALLPLDGILDLHKGVYNRVVKDFLGGKPLSLKMTTFVDAPPGSGLGSSSTLVVAMVKAYVEWLNLPLGEYDIAHLAFEIERKDVKLNGGKQDQYAAAFGGFNFIEFYADDRVIVNPLRVKNWIMSELEASLLLYYTGVSRSSATIIDQQTKNVDENREKTIEAMDDLKRSAFAMKEAILKGDVDRFAGILTESWEAKKRTATDVSSKLIDELFQTALGAGAKAGKISGAGGGGFMMFIVDPKKRMQVTRKLQEFDGQVSTCHFSHEGTQGWKLL